MKNNKIGMAINYDYPDYGGMLQAYASFRKLKDLGYDPEAINITSISKDIRNRKIKYFAKNILDGSIVKEKSQIVLKKIKRRFNKELNTNLNKRYEAFDKFQKEHFKVSREYKNWGELTKGCSEYSSVLVGSDQLWLPSNIAGDYYTLSFVPDKINKISYATSFGVSNIAKRQREVVSKFLGRINYLSAREETGQKIIKDLTGREAQLVCDPALLLTAEEWGKLFKRSFLEKYNLKHNSELRQGSEGIEFNIRVFEKVKRAVFTDKIYYHYIFNPNSISAKHNEKNHYFVIRCFEEIRKQIKLSRNRNALEKLFFKRFSYVIVATAILLNAFVEWYENKKSILGWILFIIAISFHTTAIVGIAVWFLIDNKIDYNNKKEIRKLGL